MNRFPREGRLLLILAVAVLAAAGCSSDKSVTPNETPRFTADDAAWQSGLITLGIVQVLGDLTAKAVPSVQTVTGSSIVTGEYWLDQNPSHIWTDADHRLTVQLPDFMPFLLTFDVTATSGTANGSGRFASAAVVVEFAVNDVVVAANDTPTDGTLTITTGGFTATVEFYENHTATVAINDRIWTVSWADGSVDEIVD